MQIHVLTTGYWPSTPNTDSLKIPLEISQLIDKFTLFYQHKYQGRRVSWSHFLERCIVVARFPSGKKELEVSFFQVFFLKKKYIYILYYILYLLNSYFEFKNILFSSMILVFFIYLIYSFFIYFIFFFF
jgi:hypothetical protein